MRTFNGLTTGLLLTLASVGGPLAVHAQEATPTVESSPVTFLWQSIGAEDEIHAVTEVVLDPEGKLWVTEANRDRFQILDADGTYLETWGTNGDGDGEFEFARPDGDGYGGVAFAPDGQFYVVDTGNLRVQHFAADRTFLEAWGGEGTGDGQFLEPLAIAVGPTGTVFVLDGRRDDVQEFTADGTHLRSIAVHPGSTPATSATVDVAVDDAGNIYVTELTDGAIVKFDATGTPVATIGAGAFGGEPQSLDIDDEGRIFVGDGPPGNHVLVFSPEGEVVTSWGGFGEDEGKFIYLLGIALDDAGNIYTGDYNADRVQKFRLLPPLAP